MQVEHRHDVWGVVVGGEELVACFERLGEIHHVIVGGADTGEASADGRHRGHRHAPKGRIDSTARDDMEPKFPLFDARERRWPSGDGLRWCCRWCSKCGDHSSTRQKDITSADGRMGHALHSLILHGFSAGKRTPTIWLVNVFDEAVDVPPSVSGAKHSHHPSAYTAARRLE
jgi:hypothetical protein